jgi:hypothetical protein
LQHRPLIESRFAERSLPTAFAIKFLGRTTAISGWRGKSIDVRRRTTAIPLYGMVNSAVAILPLNRAVFFPHDKS